MRSRPATPGSGVAHVAGRRRLPPQVRQGVFDRMAVAYLVSDRVEVDPPWPVAATGTRERQALCDPAEPDRPARAYVVPRAEVIDDDPAPILSRFRSSDPRTAVLMAADPLADLPIGLASPSLPPAGLPRPGPSRPARSRPRPPASWSSPTPGCPAGRPASTAAPSRSSAATNAQRVIPLETRAITVRAPVRATRPGDRIGRFSA